MTGEKKEQEELELRSEEVQELMGRTPPAIVRTGMGVTLTLVSFFMAAGCFLKCPENVAVEAEVHPEGNVWEMNAPKTGRVVMSVNGMETEVMRGDTVLALETSAEGRTGTDTVYLRAQEGGTLYKTDVCHVNETLEEGQRVFVMRTGEGGKRTVRGVAYIPSSHVGEIREGMEVEVTEYGRTLKMTVDGVAALPAKDGTYQAELKGEGDDEALMFMGRRCRGKIRVTERTVFEILLTDRLKGLVF